MTDDCRPMSCVSVVELRESFADVLNRVACTGERVVVSRRGKAVAAIVSVEDLRLLERLVREEEDRIDIASAEAARAESDEVASLDDVADRLLAKYRAKGESA